MNSGEWPNEAKKAAADWVAKPRKISTAERAIHLENYLRDMPADAPERLKFAPLLDFLTRGIESPDDLKAELEKK